MKSYIYWILCVICLPFAEFINWPSTSTCEKEFDVYSCLLRVYCFNSFDNWDYRYLDFHFLRNNGIEEKFVSTCGYGKDKVNADVFYRYQCEELDRVNNFLIPKIERNYYSNNCHALETLEIFDMSDQNCSFIPNLTEMKQLYHLNFSHNVITAAKLYNGAFLNSLTEIDYSYNKINVIDVIGEHKFINITSLNISHNELKSLPDATFDEYSKLINLDLSFNHIEKLQLMTFEGLKGLMYLNLSHNNIIEINSSLLRFKKLKVLNLSFNNMKTINAQDFMYLQNLEILDLSLNFILTIEKTSFAAMPLLNYLNLTHNLVDSVDKDLFLNNTGLAAIDISNNNLHSLPKELFKNKSIYSFSIIGNKLEGALVKGSFDGLTLVSDLDLSKQLLNSVDDYAFYGIGTLKRLVLSNNNINFLSKKSFRLLFNLVYLDLSNNKITNIDFEKDDLVSLRYLSLENNFMKQVGNNDYLHLNALNFLNLGQNNISKLEPKIFKSLQDLKYFEISNNPLSGTIEEGTFDGLNSLPKLDISGSRLRKITNNSFSGMFQLKVFNVSHSLINTLQYNTFANTSEIETIDVSYNQLTTFMLNPKYLSKLIELLLNNNKLVVISDISFTGLSSLKNIDLTSNDIQIMSNDAFKYQSDLTSLKLSFNNKMNFNVSIIKNNPLLNELFLSGMNYKINFWSSSPIPIKSLQIQEDGIKNISELNLESLSLVENVDLKYNYISALSVGELSGLKLLKTLDLSHNEIMHIQPGVFEYNTFLLYLNISYNRLKELNYGIFKGSINLQTLDVSYNTLYDLKSERFYELQSLEKLIVDHNNIESFNAQDFYALKLLSIGGNPLPCESLINLDKTPLPYQLTAINIVTKIEDNFHGITCNKNKKSKPTLNSNYTQVSENNEVLHEIRDELVRIANGYKLQTNSAPNDIEPKTNVGELFEKILRQNDENFSQLTNLSTVMVKEGNDTNMLLQKLIQILNVNRKTTTSIPLTNENATLNNILPYISKINQELDDLRNMISLEKESIMADINSKLSAISSRTENSKLTTITSTYQTPTQMSLQKLNNNVESKSVFTEVCVGLILCILVGYILYTFYKSKLFIRPRRTSSTRELESQNL